MKIALGTAQFGLDYGVTNKQGQVSLEEIERILAMSASNGIRILDSAIAYGESEKVLGQFDLSSFEVISKIPSIAQTSISMEELVEGSLERLKIERLYGLLMHDENDAEIKQFEILHELKNQGLVRKVGASFYSPEKAVIAIETGMVDLIQIPANQLDSRFEQAGVYTLADEYGVEVHVRSIFLQGLLAVENADRPQRFQHHPDLINFDKCALSLGVSPFELALMYLHNNKSVDYGVLGCVNVKQFEEILRTYNALTVAVERDVPQLSSSDDILLNPSKW
ncbi:aldo/keto reductase [Vibrio ponticus]|uniref:Aldo/keto reductase n=1 Tax=Vibrio ponticus TaxID=265668 RepID=A0A3N3DVD0_9VIBR|nr:aldo/keto reductase [Vibrio ponticus]ROV58148.1 aldo/keto reductase [Vibrio ponticus]